MKLERVDLMSVESVNKRIDFYFQYCIECDMKPAITAFAMALGLNRNRLREVCNGYSMGNKHSNPHKVAPEALTAIKNALVLIESNWEANLMSGKTNIVAGIFYGKNNFGYTDQQEVVVSQGETILNVDDIKQRYQTDQKKIETNDYRPSN